MRFPLLVAGELDVWYNERTGPSILGSDLLQPGAVVQGVTVDEAHNIDGSFYLVLEEFYQQDWSGLFVEGSYAGASAPHHAVAMSIAFGRSRPGHGCVVHFCGGRWADCRSLAGSRQVLHVGTFRVRDRRSVRDSFVGDLGRLGAITYDDPLPMPLGVNDPWGLGASLGIGGVGGARDAPVLPRRERVPDDLEPGVPGDREARLRRRLLECRVDRDGASPSDRLVAAVQLEDFDSRDRGTKRRRDRSRRRRHRRSSRSRSSSGGEDHSDDGGLFGSALTRSRLDGLNRVAERCPGRLYDSAVEKLAEYLGERGGAGSKNSMTQWVTYLQSVLQARARGQDLPPEWIQELRTLCEVLNKFGSGKMRDAADILVQRFKAVEQKALGQAGNAVGLELVQANRAGLASDVELRISGNQARELQSIRGSGRPRE